MRLDTKSQDQHKEDFIRVPQSPRFKGVCVPLVVCSPYTTLNLRRRDVTELFQSPLYASGTVFCSISHLLRHFPTSALVGRHTSSNSVTRDYCCRVREVTLIYGHVNRSYLLTYLLTYCSTLADCHNTTCVTFSIRTQTRFETECNLLAFYVELLVHLVHCRSTTYLPAETKHYR